MENTKEDRKRIEITCSPERLKARGEGDDRGWDGWMASPTQWTWVWVQTPELVMDREAWRVAVHGVVKSRTGLSDWTETETAGPPLASTWVLFLLWGVPACIVESLAVAWECSRAGLRCVHTAPWWPLQGQPPPSQRGTYRSPLLQGQEPVQRVSFIIWHPWREPNVSRALRGPPPGASERWASSRLSGQWWAGPRACVHGAGPRGQWVGNPSLLRQDRLYIPAQELRKERGGLGTKDWISCYVCGEGVRVIEIWASRQLWYICPCRKAKLGDTHRWSLSPPISTLTDAAFP